MRIVNAKSRYVFDNRGTIRVQNKEWILVFRVLLL